MEIIPIAESVTVQLVYLVPSANLTKAAHTGNFRLVIPLPASSELQQLVKLSIDSCISFSGFREDRNGNIYLLSELLDSEIIPDTLTVKMTLNTCLVSMYPPKDYYYSDFRNPDFFPYIFAGNLSSSAPDSSDEITSIIRKFKNEADNAAASVIEKIYDTDIPFSIKASNNAYYRNCFSLKKILSASGFGSRVNHGFYIPLNGDNLVRSFLFEIFQNKKSALLFSRSLVPHNNKTPFIHLFSETGGRIHAPLFGIAEKNNVIFPENAVFVRVLHTAGKHISSTDSQSSVYLRYLKSANDTVPADDFFINDSPTYRGLFPQFTCDYDTRIYYQQAAPVFLNEIILGSGRDSNKNPADIRSEYTNGEKIYCFLYLEKSKQDKSINMVWKNPSGDVYTENTDIVSKDWQSYYRTFTVRDKMEKGKWLLEIIIDGKLEGRSEFTLN